MDNIVIKLVDGAITNAVAKPQAAGDAGAAVCFEGVVREIEDGRSLEGLMYEAYRPMTDRMLMELANETKQRFGLLAISVEHSVGLVRVGACSFRLRVASTHRAEALAAMTQFIDRLKREVPLWKTPVWKVIPTPQEVST